MKLTPLMEKVPPVSNEDLKKTFQKLSESSDGCGKIQYDIQFTPTEAQLVTVIVESLDHIHYILNSCWIDSAYDIVE